MEKLQKAQMVRCCYCYTAIIIIIIIIISTTYAFIRLVDSRECIRGT